MVLVFCFLDNFVCLILNFIYLVSVLRLLPSRFPFGVNSIIPIYGTFNTRCNSRGIFIVNCNCSMRNVSFHNFDQCISKTRCHFINRFNLERCFPVDNFNRFFYHLSICSVIFPECPFVRWRTGYAKIYIALNNLVLTELIRRGNYFTIHESGWVVCKDKVNTMR